MLNNHRPLRVAVLCSHCAPGLLYLLNSSPERGVAFEERDISRDPAAVRDLTEKYKSHSTPTLVIGEEVMIGFNPERLDEILGE